MKSFFYLTLSLLILSGFQCVRAQSDYRPGYVVTMDGDTLRGFIDYRWSRSPKKISFRTTAEGVKRDYTPLDIRAFSVVGDYYESAILTIETSPSSLALMSDTSVPQLEADTAFIRNVIRGEKSLYHHYPAGVKGKKLFYISNNGQWELLVYKNYRQMQGEHVAVASNNRYISQLAFYLQDCPTIQKKMEKLRYREKSLEHLFRSYYQCTATKPAYENKVKRYALETGIMGGGVHTSLKFEAKSYLPIAHTSFSRDFSFAGGVFLDIVRKRNDGKWSLNHEVLYTSYTSDGVHYYRNTSEDNYERSRYLVDYSYMKINTMIRFKYPVSGFHLFANVGISNGIMLKDSAWEIYESLLNGEVRSEKDLLFSGGENRYEPGYLAGVGVRYKRFSFETRYERTTGMLSFSRDSFRSKVSKVAFLVSCRLTK